MNFYDAKLERHVVVQTGPEGSSNIASNAIICAIFMALFIAFLMRVIPPQESSAEAILDAQLLGVASDSR